MANQLCPPDADRSCRAYVDERMTRYRRAFDRIRAEAVAEPVRQAVVLWNEGLFFEVHEMLESVWNREQRWRKEALRGFIQAAGVFVHRERGAARAAEKLAARAVFLLRRHRRVLPEIENPEELIAALADPAKAAPVLRLSG